jgi:hypothetical protein
MLLTAHMQKFHTIQSTSQIIRTTKLMQGQQSSSDYLAKVFTLLPANNIKDKLEIQAFLDAPCQLDLPLKQFSPKEVKEREK